MTNALRSVAMIAWLTLSAFGTTRVSADEGDPPARVARLAYIEGSVSFQPGGTDAWVSPPINRPLTTGDQLWSDRGSRAELQIDGSSLRLSADTAVSLLNISDNVTQIQLSSGTVLLHVRRLDDNETYEVDTPNLAFTVLRPGVYRLTVDGSGNSTAILVRRGQGEVSGGGTAYPVGADEYDIFSGTDELREDAQNYNPPQDAFEAWSAARDARWDHSESARYVSPDVVGYEDLDDQGTWSPDPEYGYVWFPRVVVSGWAPYRNGHWAYISPWGYTWVDDSPWGFAPFHYGRWVSVRGAWAWIPAPPPRRGVVYVRPVYAPALVAWVGIGTGIAWCALGPREVYVPSYHVSQRYVNNINVSNTNVNTTIVNNVYNTTIINKTVVNDRTFANRNVAGAVVATTAEAFASAQPVGRHAVHVDPRAVAGARVETFAPSTIPTKQAVLGSGRVTATRPPAAVQLRPVVARTPAPAAPPAFERRQEAIKSNGGAPLSPAQIRQISSAAPTTANIRIAPPARMVAPATARPPATLAPARSARAPEERVPPIAPNAIHPSELPPARQPPSPAIANSALERQHLQEQQQQQARQEAERQRLQQQQEADHQRAAQETADRARQQELERQRQVQTQQLAQQRAQEQQQQQALQQRQQELERQHQVQTQQLAQQHAQEQQQLQARQQEQRRQQEAQPPPKPHKQDGSQKP
jgi:flagellar biosynthesis GTPase FlhF